MSTRLRGYYVYVRTKAKTLGQVFTPSHVADFMVALAGPTSGKALEPACGDGVFLRALSRSGVSEIVALEIDESLKIDTECDVRRESFISAELPRDFDLVIGNPPYIRWKHLPETMKSELESSPEWKTYFSSLSDYLGVFILKSVLHLRPGGQLVFITPEYWLGTSHARQLRDFLCKSGYFTDILHFSETPIFDRVASSIIIFRYVKGCPKDSQPIRVVRLDKRSKLQRADLEAIRFGGGPTGTQRYELPQFTGDAPWSLAPREISRRLDLFERACTRVADSLFFEEGSVCTLGELVDIGNGLVSGCDAAFRLHSTKDLTPAERNAVLQVAKGRDLSSYRCRAVTPYIFANDYCGSESEFRELFPNFDRQLAEHRDRLEARYSYGKSLPYWHWSFLRSLELFKRQEPKLMVPCKDRIDKAKSLRFAIVPPGVYPTQDVTALVVKPGVREHIYYLAALLNGEHMFEWVRHRGLMKGNIAEFSESPLARMPIRLIDWTDAAEVRTHWGIVEWVEAYRDTGDSCYMDKVGAEINRLLSRSAPATCDMDRRNPVASF